MRKFLKTLPLFLLLLILAGHFSGRAYASEIYFTDPVCYVGDQVTVTMSVTPAVAGVDIKLWFSTDYLSFVSCSGGTGNLDVKQVGGSLAIFDYDSKGTNTFTYSLVFNALQTGTGTVGISEAMISDNAGEETEITHKGSSAVTIQARPTASSEARLASLTFNPGSLSPAFDPNVYSYTLNVPATASSLAFSFTKMDGNAKVDYNNYLRDIPVGTLVFKLWVTAEDGTTKATYTVSIVRPQPETQAPQTQPATEESSTEESTEESTEASVARVISRSLSIELLEIPLEVVIPYGYEIIDYVTEAGITCEAIAPVGVEGYNHYIFYGKKADGTEGLYLYDCVEKTLQRYKFVVTNATVEVETLPSTEESSEKETSEEAGSATAGSTRAGESQTSAPSTAPETQEGEEDSLLNRISNRLLLLVIALLLIATGAMVYVLAKEKQKQYRKPNE